jgi:hypothetical protein
LSRSSTRTLRISASVSGGLAMKIVGARLVARAHGLAVRLALIITTGSVGPWRSRIRAQVSKPDSPGQHHVQEHQVARLARQQLERFSPECAAIVSKPFADSSAVSVRTTTGSSSTTRIRPCRK